MAGLDIKSRKTVLLAEAYSEVKSCLYITRLARQQDIPVEINIFGNADLYRFLKMVNETTFNKAVSIRFHDIYPTVSTNASVLKRIWRYIMDIIGRRSYYRRIYQENLSGLKDSDIYFFTRYMSPYNYYFLKRLGNSNRITYVCTLDYPNLKREKRIGSIYDLLSLWKLKATYGCGITYVRLPHAKLEYLPDHFIDTYVTQTFNLEQTDNLLKKFDFNEFRVFDSSRFLVMYFDQPLVTSGRIADTALFRRELDTVFSILKRYFPDDRIALKYHPVSHTDKSFIQVGEVIDDSLPAEVLYHPNIKVYLSFSSSALANVEQGLAVSLLDLITFKDKEAKRFIKETLIGRSRSRILFPQTPAELEKIIAATAGK